MKVNIGVELGAKLIQAAIINKDGRLVARDKAPTNMEKDLSMMVLDAVQLIHKLLQEEELDIRNVKSIGVAIPGIVDEEGCRVLKAHVMNLMDAPIQEEFQKHYDVPIYVENDAHCAAIAESTCGAAENLEISMTINVGTGISGGIMMYNRLYTGYANAGAVIGHVVVDRHGKECYCGQRGCFEALCSAKALIETTREIAEKNPDSKIHQVCGNDLSQINVKTLWEAMTLGDAEAKAAYQEYVENFSVALSIFANILMPEAIVVCGGITGLGEELMRPVREKVFKAIYSKDIATLPLIKQSEMGSASVLVGAGMLSAYKRDAEE
jgi:glucokinase